MEKELIINSTPTDVEIALLEDKKLVELHYQKTNSNFTVGDIFLGKVKKFNPGLNAVFIDIGHPKDAFLHYTDLGPKLSSLTKFTQKVLSGEHTQANLDDFVIEPDIHKNGKIEQVVDRKFPILVQILKEQISTKGPRLSCEINLPGRFIVLTPFSNTISVSKKIASSKERDRLKQIIQAVRPHNFGVIVRTAAEGKGNTEIQEEMNLLMEKWEDIFNQLKSGNKAPQKLLSELDKTSSILRDLLNDKFNAIAVNDREMYHHIRAFLHQNVPDMVNIVTHFSPQKNIFDHYKVTKQIKSSFGKTATMNSGAYIVIDHTEAMHVIDVNSGHKVSKALDQENSALAVNIEATEEIARQLRLRDIGGLIVIDFIDVRQAENKTAIYNAMKQHMAKDRAQHTILPLSKFGLMQITRQRVRPELKISTAEACPACAGSGKITAPLLVTDNIERDLNYIMEAQSPAQLSIQAHPFVCAYLTKGFYNHPMRWLVRFHRWIKIKPNTALQIMEYRFFDKYNEEIRLD